MKKFVFVTLIVLLVGCLGLPCVRGFQKSLRDDEFVKISINTEGFYLETSVRRYDQSKYNWIIEMLGNLKLSGEHQLVRSKLVANNGQRYFFNRVDKRSENGNCPSQLRVSWMCDKTVRFNDIAADLDNLVIVQDETKKIPTVTFQFDIENLERQIYLQHWVNPSAEEIMQLGSEAGCIRKLTLRINQKDLKNEIYLP